MSERDIDLLPFGFLKKYGTMLTSIDEFFVYEKFKQSKNYNGRYNQIEKLDRLLTNDEKQEIEDEKAFNLENATNDPWPVEQVDYMKRQPRVNVRAMNYNFEQFRSYTAMYETARHEDKEKSEQFYKLVKYVLARTNEDGTPKEASNLVVRDFLRKWKLELIEIPEEFKDLEVEDDFKPKQNNKSKKRRIYTRSDKFLDNYDAWRSVDRALTITSGKDKAECKVMLSPALLKKAFGRPETTSTGFTGTGQYDFEDNNLDLFKIHDYKQTQFYRGLNREEAFYYTYRNMRRPEKRRVKKWPTPEEFWNSTEPVPFRLLAAEQANWRQFRRWLMQALRKAEGSDFDYDKESLEKFEDQIELCLGDYDEVGHINTDMAIFKWDNTVFMTEEEIKALPEEKKQKREPAVMFDLSRAERTPVNKDELKVQEI
jgi:hypothetical protein